MISPQPKPTPRAKLKARAQRAESRHAQQVRAQVGERDGDCRLGDPSLWLIFGACEGESEWAHMPEKRRSKTRGLPATERHTTAGSVRLCSWHHAKVDRRGPRPWIDMQPATSRGADGPLGFQIRDTVYVEPNR